MVDHEGRRRIPTEDGLSSLPDILIEQILARLPLREAARTSILSSTWPDLWTTRPSLVFDDSSFTSSKVWKKWLEAIFKVLNSQCGPLKEFTLSVPRSIYHGTGSIKLDQILRFLSEEACTESLSLEVEGGRYFISKRIFASFAKHLNALHLSGCRLLQTSKGQLSLEGFSTLTLLELKGVEAVTSKTGWPVRSVEFRYPMLSTLVLDNSFADHYHPVDILIEAPQLTRFHFVGKFTSLWLKATPLLKNVSLSCVKSSPFFKPEGFTRIFDGLPMVESLTLSYRVYEYLKDVTRMPFPINHLLKLKHLRMTDLWMNRLLHVWCVITLLSAGCFSLQTLTLDMNITRGYADDKISEVLATVASLGTQNGELRLLKRVEMNDVTGTKVEVAFITKLLAISPSLQHMEIKWHAADGDIKTKSAIIAQLQKLRRASPSATISVK